MDIDSLISAVKAKMGEIIQKPKMIDKLLQKPPFRFLHDTITAVTNTTGFGDGLYSGEELDSASITDRQAKVNYLEKIFNLVAICKVSVLDHFDDQSSAVCSSFGSPHNSVGVTAHTMYKMDTNYITLKNAPTLQRTIDAPKIKL